MLGQLSHIIYNIFNQLHLRVDIPATCRKHLDSRPRDIPYRARCPVSGAEDGAGRVAGLGRGVGKASLIGLRGRTAKRIVRRDPGKTVSVPVGVSQGACTACVHPEESWRHRCRQEEVLAGWQFFITTPYRREQPKADRSESALRLCELLSCGWKISIANEADGDLSAPSGRAPQSLQGFLAPLCREIWIQDMDQAAGLFVSAQPGSLRNEILAHASGFGAHLSAYAVWKDLCGELAMDLFQSGDVMIKLQQTVRQTHRTGSHFGSFIYEHTSTTRCLSFTQRA